MPSDIDVLVTHMPPLGHGDQDADGEDKRAGSRTLLQRVTDVQPRLHIFGHIHGGHGVSRGAGGPTVFVNASICDNDYRPVQKPILIELCPDPGPTADGLLGPGPDQGHGPS